MDKQVFIHREMNKQRANDKIKRFGCAQNLPASGRAPHTHRLGRTKQAKLHVRANQFHDLSTYVRISTLMLYNSQFYALPYQFETMQQTIPTIHLLRASLRVSLKINI